MHGYIDKMYVAMYACDINIYIYIYMHVYSDKMHVAMYTCAYLYRLACACVYEMYTCMFYKNRYLNLTNTLSSLVATQIYSYIVILYCINIRICVPMYIYMYVCVCMYMCAYVCICGTP